MTPWTVAFQPSLSMGFSRQEYWSGLPFPSPRDLPNPGIEPGIPILQGDSLPSKPPGKWFEARCKYTYGVLAQLHTRTHTHIHKPQSSEKPYPSGPGICLHVWPASSFSPPWGQEVFPGPLSTQGWPQADIQKRWVFWPFTKACILRVLLTSALFD